MRATYCTTTVYSPITPLSTLNCLYSPHLDCKIKVLWDVILYNIMPILLQAIIIIGIIYYLQVVPLLSHPNDEIVCEVLAFLKAMLYSGNCTVQRGFRHLLETREERLFTTLSNLLQCAAITYKEMCVL